MPVTQEDVALVAGVSRRTVSNVVNDYAHISADVRRRVEEAIAQLGYTPSHAARSLRTGRSGVVQLVIPELDVPYFAELARGVVASAEELGLSVLITQTSGDPDRELASLGGVTGEHAEGTILSAVNLDEAALAGRSSASPIVLVGERRIAGYPHVGIDDVAAARVATEHLLARGRRRIAFVGADERGRLHMADMRQRGFREAMASAGAAIDESLIVPTASYHRADGADALGRLLASGSPFDAVFCATDLLAIGVMSAARTNGMRVPDDIAVVGFDDLEEGRYSNPTLSSVSPDKDQIARTAVELLVAGQQGGEAVEGELIVPFTFMARQSTDV